MLLQFSVQNFRSIKERVTLDMQALDGRSIKEHKDSLIAGNTLPVVAIYGPNGGGKTTLLLAFRAMQFFVTKMFENYGGGQLSQVPPNLCIPFWFDNESKNKPTCFEVVIELQNIQYKYGFDVFNNVIKKEYLYKREKNSEIELLYERIEQKVSIPCKNISGTITENMASKVSQDMPLLVFINQFYNESPIKDIVQWFLDSRFIDYNDVNQEGLLLNIIIEQNENKEFKKEILKILKAFDIKVFDYEIRKIDQNINLPHGNFKQRQIEFKTIHKIGDKEISLSFQWESMGTKKIVGLVPFIISSLKVGFAFFIDELDSKLHPKLLEQIIGLYTNPDINTGGGQLIFTSHDMTTMNSKIFRRDEIYFMALTDEQDSELYSLIEIKEDDGKVTRKDGNIAKRYLEGRYGADPYFEKISNWGQSNV
ncbi:MAG: ATP-binding protein [Firmicutes bacterium]|nr:ATP-binding protein [Bacillota bacterium]MCL1944952.1 ATP-binding protein [Bacillota bacterium]MCL1954237.1 ATP-binding protein [Bacillota bacterium]